jgi:hypothetical protein
MTPRTLGGRWIAAARRAIARKLVTAMRRCTAWFISGNRNGDTGHGDAELAAALTAGAMQAGSVAYPANLHTAWRGSSSLVAVRHGVLSGRL